MRLILIAAVTSDFWLTPLGIKMQGGSCLSSIGGFVGGAIGTFAIPIPVIGWAKNAFRAADQST